MPRECAFLKLVKHNIDYTSVLTLPFSCSVGLSAAVNPMTAIANIGSNFTFECAVSADPPLSPSSLNITWIKHALPGSPVVICSGATCSGNTLTITNVQEDDQALYFCRVNAPGRMPAMSIVGSMLEIVGECAYLCMCVCVCVCVFIDILDCIV